MCRSLSLLFILVIHTTCYEQHNEISTSESIVSSVYNTNPFIIESVISERCSLQGIEQIEITEKTKELVSKNNTNASFTRQQPINVDLKSKVEYAQEKPGILLPETTKIDATPLSPLNKSFMLSNLLRGFTDIACGKREYMELLGCRFAELVYELRSKHWNTKSLPLEQTTEVKNYVPTYSSDEISYSQMVLHFTSKIEPVIVLYNQSTILNSMFTTTELPQCLLQFKSETNQSIPWEYICGSHIPILYPNLFAENNMLRNEVPRYDLEQTVKVQYLSKGYYQKPLKAKYALNYVFTTIDSESVVEFWICKPEYSSILYPDETLQGTFQSQFQANPFRPNFSNYPNIKYLSNYCQFASLEKVGMQLVVPGDSIFAYRAKTTSKLLHYSFLDVSNLLRFTEQSAVDSFFESKSTKQKIKQLQNNFQSKKDTAPKVAPGFLPAFSRYPTVNNTKSKQTKLFKNWQEQKKWVQRMKELTFQMKSKLAIIDVGRHNITIGWDSIDVGMQHHLTQATVCFRKVIQGQLLHVQDNETTLGDSINNDTLATNNQMEQLAKSHPISFLETFEDNTHVQIECQVNPLTESKTTTTLTKLEPNTLYKIRVRVQTLDTKGIFSPWTTSTVKTVDNSAPVPPPAPYDSSTKSNIALTWNQPYDNGGAPIEEFVIWKSRAHVTKKGMHLHPREEIAGIYVMKEHCDPCIKNIENLIPGKRYRFRIQAINKYGTSGYSDYSDVLLQHQREKIQIGGIGSPLHHHHGISLRRRQLSGIENQQKTTFLTLDDELHRILIHDTEEMEVLGWAAHFSPKTYSVHSQSVLSQPFHGCNPLSNQNDALHRIVVIQRGRCPINSKVRNAYDAGAIGVIIIDEANGKCRTSFNHDCVMGSSKDYGEGFAMHDDHALWDDMDIPVLLLHHEDGVIIQRHSNG